jgi:arsenate reductase
MSVFQSSHEEVVDAMEEIKIDISDRTPREVTFDESTERDYVITMGCSADDVCPAGWAGENRDWDRDDPTGNHQRRSQRFGTTLNSESMTCSMSSKQRNCNLTVTAIVRLFIP